MKPKMSSFFLNGDELGHGLAALGDEHGLAFGLNFIHDFQAMDFELARRHCLHVAKAPFDHGYYTMVISPKSLWRLDCRLLLAHPNAAYMFQPDFVGRYQTSDFDYPCEPAGVNCAVYFHGVSYNNFFL